MIETILNVKYRCQHPSCQVFCKKGKLTIEESMFEELSAAFEEDGLFKSPRDACRMGYSQPFKVVSIEAEGAEEVRGDIDSADPVEILRQEHLEVLKKLDIVESQVKKRQLEELWISTAALEDEIMRHSIEKEEGTLFPLLRNKSPMAEVFMQIVNEDHKEFISLLHSFRCGLQEDDILDGIINSVIINLKNHIRKEDEEFFSMVDESLDERDRAKLLEGMKRVDEKHVTIVAGDRGHKIESPFLENRKILNAEIDHIRKEYIVDDWGCHCNGE